MGELFMKKKIMVIIICRCCCQDTDRLFVMKKYISLYIYKKKGKRKKIV